MVKRIPPIALSPLYKLKQKIKLAQRAFFFRINHQEPQYFVEARLPLEVKMKTFTPRTEGVDHINAYSKSKTRLGYLLSNFAYTPFTCEDGDFASIEGYWYWLGSPPDKREPLRKMSGLQARRFGKSIGEPECRLDELIFKQKIRKAINAKFKAYPEIRKLLAENSELPIVHYYAYGNPPKIITPKDGEWIWEHWEVLKKYV